MTGPSRTRAAVSSLVVLALLALAPAVGRGQGALGGGGAIGGAGGPVAAAPDPVLLPTSRASANRIKAAHEYLAAKDWDNAARLLQRVLDESEDSLLESDVTDAQGNVAVRRTSARAEAENLIAGLPKQGFAVYKVKVGGLALAALARARANPRLLDEVVRRYALTDAGADALTQMGVAELDRGRTDEAADRFRRLLKRPDADDLPPLTLFQAALAFHAVHDAVREDRAMQNLGRHIGPTGLPVGDKTLNLDDLRKEIARWPTAAADSPDWPLFRGDPRRAGRAGGELPLLPAPRVRAAIPVYDEAARLLAPAVTPGQPPPAPGPALPGFVPIAVGGKLIYRGPDGLHALDAGSGREIWRSTSPFCLDLVLKDDQKKWQLRRWLEKYRGLPSLLDENATLGTLASDGRRVYFVEDLPVPPHPQDVIEIQQEQAPMPNLPPPPRHWFSTAEENLYHNRLRAVDVATGDLRWEVGGWDKTTQKDPSKDFEGFLGAPLPVGRQLFVLGERSAEVVLLCLDPATGRELWAQQLATVPASLPFDPARRMQPALLAYADGVLVCPTHVGAVVAVDPLSHNLLWADLAPRRTNNAADDNAPPFTPDDYEAQLRGCAPMVHRDRVVVATPDGGAIRCLDLHDGSRKWMASCSDDDLYVAGVFDDPAGGDKVLVVGKNSCRALKMDDGSEAWARPVVTGTPSGFGAADGNLYLLPLRNGNLFRIDVIHPDASTPIEGSPDAPPGNLVFQDGDLWSQSAKAVVAYRRLAEGLEQAGRKAAAAPHDAAARIERGALLYGKGDVAGAVEDWLAALDADPPADVAVRTRDRLFPALAQLLRTDFSANERYLALYEDVRRRPPPADATPAQLQSYQAEQRRRLLDRLALTALGREGQGRVDLALKAYRELADAAVPDELMTAPEDPALRIRPAVWVRRRVAGMAQAVAPEQRRLLQDQIDRDWAASRSSGGADLERFVGLYGTVPGPLGAAGREARLLLAERRMDDRGHALEAELNLHHLRRQTDSPEIAARAQGALARLLTRHGQFADALEAYRGLARDFPAAVRDGKTGAALLADLAADKRFLPYLDDPLAGRPAGHVKFVEQQINPTQLTPDIPCEPQDGVAPAACCRNLLLRLDPRTFALKGSAVDGGAEPWTIPLPVPVSYLRPYFDAANGTYSATYQATDHFLVVSLGPVIVGVDRIGRRALWVRGLPPADLPPDAVLQPAGADGGVYVQSANRPTQRLGVVGPVGPDGVCVETAAGVASLDLATGGLRWLRTGVEPILDGFGDDQVVYLVESRTPGDVRAVRAVRVADGSAVPIPDCVDLYNHKLRTLGRRLLVSEQGPRETVNLRLYDAQTGQDLWKKTFPARSVVLESTVPELAAVAAPDGSVTVVDLDARKELVRLAVDPKQLDKVTRGMLLRDRTQFYLAFQGSDTAPDVVNDPAPNFSPPAKWTEVSGMIYAFDRATGALNWDSKALSQILLLDHFEESPVLLLSAIQQHQGPAGPGGVQTTQITSTRSIDKRTGKVVYRKEAPNPGNPLCEVEMNIRTGTVDLVSGATRLRHYLDAR